MIIPIPILLMLFFGLVALIILIVQISYKMGHKKASYKNDEWVEDVKKDALDRQRSVIKGKVSEQLAPFFPNFPFKSSECRFLGSPIDLIVFNGMDDGYVESVYLVDIKTNLSRLSPLQRSIVEAVNSKNVFWHTYQIDLERDRLIEHQLNMHDMDDIFKEADRLSGI